MLRSRSTLPPYLTSGAASRSHHALLVKLHEAASEQEQEDILAAEVRRIKLALSTKDSNSSKIYEHLLILLHIASTRKRTGDDLEFALVPALQLAEGGKTIKERRLGYLFLSERLPAGHELNLLLVNTIRKDLSSQKPSHILLALHTIVKLPARELCPAVTPILLSSALLKHPEGAVRQRALEALQALHIDTAPVKTGTAGDSVSRPTFPLSMSKVTRLLAKERDASVAAVIFRLMSQMIKSAAHTMTSEEERLFLVEQVDRTLAQLELGPGRQLARDAVSCLGVLMDGAGGEVKAVAAETLIGLLHPAPSAKATLLEICRLASIVSSEKLTDALFARVRSLMGTSSTSDPDAPSSSVSIPAARPKPTDHILALRCLDALKEESWAGRLGEEDMAAVMEGMNSPDDTIRRATLRLLHEADSSLTRSALQSLLDSIKNASDLFLPLRLAVDSTVEQKTRAGIDETAKRCLEVAEVRMKGDIALGTARYAYIGNAYAGEVAETLDAWTVAQQVTGDPGYQIWDDGVAIVMDLLRQAPAELSSTTARGLVVGAKGHRPEKLSPTQQALGCEACAAFARHDELEAAEIISAVLTMTSYTSGLIRDQAFVSAFAVLARCSQGGARDRLSQETLSKIDSARDGSGRVNSRRVDQLRFLIEHYLIEAVVEESRSGALADLALAIDSVHARESAARHRKAERQPESEEPKDWPTRPRDLATSQLRYDAYDAPPSR